MLEKLNAKAIKKYRGAPNRSGSVYRTGERIDNQPEESNNKRSMQACNGPHLRSRQRSEIEFQADREQQQRNTKIRQFLPHVTAGDTLRV